MRISDSMRGQNLINNINRNKSYIDELRTKIALNSKIRKPSDEPIGTARVLNLTDQLRELKRLLKILIMELPSWMIQFFTWKACKAKLKRQWLVLQI